MGFGGRRAGKSRIKRSGIVLVFALAVAWAVAPMPSAAASDVLAQTAVASPAALATADRVVRFGAPEPAAQRTVLFVHGWLSTSVPVAFGSGEAFSQSPFDRPVTWRDGSGRSLGRATSASLHDRLERMPGVALYAFDYSAHSSEWVGSERTSGNLATAIRNIAADQGTKVDVVAHSMGGLALRYALAASPGLADLIGRVVTVGTPSEGSDIANAAVDISDVVSLSLAAHPILQNLILPTIGNTCTAALETDARGGCQLPPVIRTGIAALGDAGEALRADSDEIAQLPPWPAELSVHAISGSASVTLPLGDGEAFSVKVGDGLVSQASAIADADTSTVVACEFVLPAGPAALPALFSGNVVLPPFGGACAHDALFSNQEIVRAVLDGLDLGAVATAPPADLGAVSAPADLDAAITAAHRGRR